MAGSTDSTPPETGKVGMTTAMWKAAIALALSYTTIFQQLSCLSVVATQITQQLGPTSYDSWFLTSYTLALAIALPIVGEVSDEFGRRNLILGGNVLALIGTIIGAAAQNVPMLIVAMTLKGLAGAGQTLALAAVGEIIPNKYRGYAQAAFEVLVTPYLLPAALYSNVLVKEPRLGWRTLFLIGIGLNLLTLVLLWFWYKPVTAKHLDSETRKRRLSHLDWVGIILLAAASILFLLACSWGGLTHPWNSAATVVPLVLGICGFVAFGLWEWKGARYPFMAHELFRGDAARGFPIMLIIAFVCGMTQYSIGSFWTQQVQTMFFRDPIKVGLYTMPTAVGSLASGFFAGLLLGKHWLFRANLMMMYGAAWKIIGDGVLTTITPRDFALAVGMSFLVGWGPSWLLITLQASVQLATSDEHLGLTTMIIQLVRAFGGSVALTIYSSLLSSALNKDIPTRLGTAVLGPPYNVPPSSLEPLIPLLNAGNYSGAAQLPGLSTGAVDAATEALKLSYGLGFRNIYYASLAFSILAFIVSIFVTDSTKNMTDHVAVSMGDEKETIDSTSHAAVSTKDEKDSTSS